MATYIIVDAANLFHRAKHVTTGDAALKAGMAMHIAFNALRQVWRKFNGSHIVVCLEGRSWRRDIYPEYKAHRRVQDALKTKHERDEDELYFSAMAYFSDFLARKTNVTVLQCDGLEADDLIARWIDLHPEDAHVIVSGDSDFYQLLSSTVKMYDGVKSWTISTSEVLDENDKPATTKRTLTTKNEKGKEVKTQVIIPVEPPVPEYELFKKIVRGDASDNIMSANPGVREDGSMKKPGIREAFNDRHLKGYDWNNFMQQTWKKVTGTDEDGNILTTPVKVLDEFKINQQLVDLRAQPENIKDLADTTIVTAIQKDPQSSVGVWFLRFCNEMSLNNISKYPQEYATMLSAPYAKK